MYYKRGFLISSEEMDKLFFRNITNIQVVYDKKVFILKSTFIYLSNIFINGKKEKLNKGINILIIIEK